MNSYTDSTGVQYGIAYHNTSTPPSNITTCQYPGLIVGYLRISYTVDPYTMKGIHVGLVDPVTLQRVPEHDVIKGVFNAPNTVVTFTLKPEDVITNVYIATRIVNNVPAGIRIKTNRKFNDEDDFEDDVNNNSNPNDFYGGKCPPGKSWNRQPFSGTLIGIDLVVQSNVVTYLRILSAPSLHYIDTGLIGNYPSGESISGYVNSNTRVLQIDADLGVREDNTYQLLTDPTCRTIRTTSVHDKEEDKSEIVVLGGSESPYYKSLHLSRGSVIERIETKLALTNNDDQFSTPQSMFAPQSMKFVHSMPDAAALNVMESKFGPEISRDIVMEGFADGELIGSRIGTSASISSGVAFAFRNYSYVSTTSILTEKHPATKMYYQANENWRLKTLRFHGTGSNIAGALIEFASAVNGSHVVSFEIGNISGSVSGSTYTTTTPQTSSLTSVKTFHSLSSSMLIFSGFQFGMSPSNIVVGASTSNVHDEFIGSGRCAGFKARYDSTTNRITSFALIFIKSAAYFTKPMGTIRENDELLLGADVSGYVSSITFWHSATRINGIRWIVTQGSNTTTHSLGSQTGTFNSVTLTNSSSVSAIKYYTTAYSNSLSEKILVGLQLTVDSVVLTYGKTTGADEYTVDDEGRQTNKLIGFFARSTRPAGGNSMLGSLRAVFKRHGF